MALSNNKYLAIIPARAGSKGIPGKNFLTFGSRRVIDYTVSHASHLLDLADVVVSTDEYGYLAGLSKLARERRIDNLSDEIISLGDSLFFHKRAIGLSQDGTHIMEVIGEILAQFSRLGKTYVGVLLLQPTVPFRSKMDLEQIRFFLQSEANETSSLITFRRVEDSHPARMYKLEKDNLFHSIDLYQNLTQTRRQDLPELFLRDGCYYFIGNELINAGLQFGSASAGFIRDFPWNLNLDTRKDLDFAKFIFNHYLDLLKEEGAF